MVHGTPVKSVSQEPKSGPIPDDHSHHAAYEVQFGDILMGVLIGVFRHHWRCKCDVAHLVFNTQSIKLQQIFPCCFTSNFSNHRDPWFNPLMYE